VAGFDVDGSNDVEVRLFVRMRVDDATSDLGAVTHWSPIAVTVSGALAESRGLEVWDEHQGLRPLSEMYFKMSPSSPTYTMPHPVEYDFGKKSVLIEPVVKAGRIRYGKDTTLRVTESYDDVAASHVVGMIRIPWEEAGELAEVANRAVRQVAADRDSPVLGDVIGISTSDVELQGHVMHFIATTDIAMPMVMRLSCGIHPWVQLPPPCMQPGH